MNNNTIPDRSKFKTAVDFLDWLDRRKAYLRQAADEKTAQQSAMRWADDGGRPADSSPAAPPDASASPAGD